MFLSEYRQLSASGFFSKALLLASLATLGACIGPAPKNPQIQFKHAPELRAAQRIALAEHEPSASVTETLGEDLSPRFEAGIREYLVERGYVLVDDAAAADLVLSWQFEIQEKMDMRTYDVLSYFGCWRCGPSKSDVEMEGFVQGKLIVYLRDPRTNKPLWRSILQKRIDPEVDSEGRDEQVTEACRTVLADFPPRES